MSSRQVLGLTLARAGRFSSGSTNRRILKAALTVGTLTVGVKALSLVKDVGVAARFGTGPAVEAFLIAYVLPTFVLGIVSGSINAVLIPAYIHARQDEGQIAADRLFSSAVVIAVGLLGFMALALAFVGHAVLPLLTPHSNPSQQALTNHLLYWLLPSMLLTGTASIWGAVLNAREQFWVVAVAPAVIPLSMVILLGATPAPRAELLPAGIFAGGLLQLGILGCALHRWQIPIFPRWHGHDPRLQHMLRRFGPMLLAGLLMNTTPVVDQFLASLLRPGSVAALGYGNKLTSLTLGLGTAALSTALLPYLSVQVAGEDWAAVRLTVKTYSWLIVVVTVPLTIVLVVLSRPVVALVFQHGAFTGNDTLLVAKVQALSLLQIPFYTLCSLLVRLLSALRLNAIVTYGTLVCCVANVVLDYLLMLRFGVAGLALSTTCVYALSLCFLATMVIRYLPEG